MSVMATEDPKPGPDDSIDEEREEESMHSAGGDADGEGDGGGGIGGHNISNSSKSSYRQKYKPAWELDGELRGWLTACQSDPYSGYCKFCRTKLHAHKKGLLAHAKSAKHKKHTINPNTNFDPMALLPADSFNVDTGDEDGNMDDSDGRGSKRNNRGRTLFNDSWIKDPLFHPWLRKVSTNNTKAFCAACRCIITAGRCELVKHSRAAKHKKAIIEGRPLEEIGEIELHWLEVSSNQNQGFKDDNQMNSSLNASSYNQQASFRSAAIDLPGMPVDEILDRLDKHVPLELAEKWDNVGIITKPTQQVKVNNILLTIDLNERIVEEAIRKRVQFIISYHPPIFSSIKSLNPKNWKDKAILMCVEHRITVYSPHTALDAIKGGINDWLVSSFIPIDDQQNHKIRPIQHSSTSHNSSCCLEVLLSEPQETVAPMFKDMNNVTMTEYNNSSTDVRLTCDEKTLREVVEQLARNNYTQVYSKVTQLAPNPIPGVGMGRIVTFATPLPLYEVVHRTKTHLDLNQIRLALSSKHTRDTKVNTIAVCAGSGSSVLKGCSADVWITGEMSHHEVLDAINSGVTVLLCEHSNTERGYLRNWVEHLSSAVFEDKVHVAVSDLDKEPLRIV